MILLQSAGLAGIIGWSALLLGLLVGGMALAFRLKRRLTARDDEEPVPSAGFTLSDLRQIHRAGQMTDAEFERARAKIVAASQNVSSRELPTATPIRDSTDAIRARRQKRAAQGSPPEDAEIDPEPPSDNQVQ